MKKYMLCVLILAAVLVYGCAQQTDKSPTAAEQEPIVDETPAGLGVEEAVVEETAEEPEKEAAPPAPAEPEAAVKEFTMAAEQWDFNPETITVNQGDKVRITITSKDVTHGFYMPDFNINERLDPGKPVTVEFVADKTGTFTFRCNVPCGSGHGGMNGKLVVE